MSINEQMSDAAARKSRRFFFSPDLLIPTLLFIISVIIFRQTNLDMQFQSVFHQSEPGWYLKDFPLFSLVYHYGNIPALLIAIAGLTVFGLGFQLRRFIRWRKIGLFLALAMLLGPGLIINAMLKDHWGRPRPRNVIEFGGKYAYEKLLSIDPSSPGLSFPCGHCSMGFYLFIPWFVLRKRKPLLAAISLLSGIFYGLLIGVARVAQGGHWLSDVIVAGIIVYLTGTVLFYLLKLNRDIWHQPGPVKMARRKRLLITISVAVALIFLVIGVILATPYSQKKSYESIDYPNLSPQPNLVDIELSLAEVEVISQPLISFKIQTQGFGFPGSKLTPVFEEIRTDDTLRVSFSQRKKGFFTELDNKIFVEYPFTDSGIFNLHLHKGNISMSLPEDIGAIELNLRIGKGILELDLPSQVKPRITLKGDFNLTDKTGFHSADSIYVKEDFRVNIILKQGSLILR